MRQVVDRAMDYEAAPAPPEQMVLGARARPQAKPSTAAPWLLQSPYGDEREICA